MHAPAIRRPFRTSPSLTAALRTIVAAQLAMIVAATLLSAGPSTADQRPAPAGGPLGAAADPSFSEAPIRATERTIASAAPTEEAVRGATGKPALTPRPRAAATRPPQPVPSVSPGTILAATPPPVAVSGMGPSSGGSPSSGALSAGSPAGNSSSGGSGGSSKPAPAAAPNLGGPLPSCAYLDVLTPHRGLGDWSRTLLDTTYQLPASYAPGDLVDTSAAGLNGGYAVRSLVVGDLAAMAADARAAGAPLAVVSAYRSYSKQQGTFQNWVNVSGYDAALRTSARPGHSEHQLGTTIDLTSEGGAAPWDYGDWAATPAGAWVAQNSWRYGFVVSYPRGSFNRTCYSYEPWHVRYVGRERAAAIARSGLTPREVLWSLQ